MKLVLAVLILLCNPGLLHAQEHHLWSQLLQKHVDEFGRVNYIGLQKERNTLNQYLEQLRKTHPENMPKKASMAFWINAYNAFTVQLILDHYPVNSIKDIQIKGKNAWEIPFIQIHGKTYTLDQIQKEKLGAFKDARVHFAINCAAKSCPPLANTAFEAINLESSLEARTQLFLNNPKYNTISDERLDLSMIFVWYAAEFDQQAGSSLDFIRRYVPIKLKTGIKITFLEYDWALNN
jgi:hypothetical protein